MSEIKSFLFDNTGVEKIRSHKYGTDWPVVYVLENGKDLYVGETIRAYGRTRQHLENEKRKKLKNVHIISDDEFNKSATLDIESSLIEYFVADGKFQLQNGNGGLQNHDYFDREKYKSKFEVLWKKLQDIGLAIKDLRQIRNSDLFKYSPYKTLTDDQYLVANQLLRKLEENQKQVFVIHGGPGTGKTILATYLMKQLAQKSKQKVGLVVKMVSLRNTIQKVFRSIPGLKSTMVIGPAQAVGNNYDILIVDETHRLNRRKNIPNYGSFDQTNKKLGLGNEGDELDWILASAKQVVLFYDERQSVRPSDISSDKIKALKPNELTLKSQVRVKGGDEYLQFVDDLLDGKTSLNHNFQNYDFKVFDDLSDMVTAIKQQDKEHSLARMVAGYAWKWHSARDSSKYDIEIDGEKLRWNSQTSDWVNSANAVNEVGCIHTTQGYDLNYAGVIIGPELSYDPVKDEFVVDHTKYKDMNGHRGVSDPEELKRYVINIYKTLMTRGILGTYVYVCDENLRSFLLQKSGDRETSSAKLEEPVISPYTEQIVSLPLYDSIGCGEATYADPTAVDQIEVPGGLLQPGAKYFVLRTTGDSMNELGIEDGDLILCQKNYHAPSGSIAVVLIDDDATLKQIKYEHDGLLLTPRSTNPLHKPYKLGEVDEFKVLGTFVKKIDIDL